jgi:hypothetical protein
MFGPPKTQLEQLQGKIFGRLPFYPYLGLGLYMERIPEPSPARPDYKVLEN